MFRIWEFGGTFLGAPVNKESNTCGYLLEEICLKVPGFCDLGSGVAGIGASGLQGLWCIVRPAGNPGKAGTKMGLNPKP